MVAPDDCSVGGGSFQLSRAEWRLNWHCLYDRLRCPLVIVLYYHSRTIMNGHVEEIDFEIVGNCEFLCLFLLDQTERATAFFPSLNCDFR